MNSFLATEAQQEVDAFFSPLAGSAIRVLVIRHGMGSHNSFAGIGSLMSEDAELNECGKAQADCVGDYLRKRGITEKLSLAVISPFTRTLQTACHILGNEIGVPADATQALRAERYGYILEPRDPARSNPLEVIVHPLCAEDTMARSHVCRGNRGSTVNELKKQSEFNVFDFSEVDEYCQRRCVDSKDECQAGKWWHHGPHSEETEGSFARRMADLRKWLGDLVSTKQHPLHVIVVSHGGVMEEAFGYRPTAPNCGFRVFDITKGGATYWTSTNELVANHVVIPSFVVHSVVPQPDRVDGHREYKLEIGVGTDIFSQAIRESQLRSDVYDQVKTRLSSELYAELRLNGKFPSRVRINHSRSDPSIFLQDYLEELALAMSHVDFDANLIMQIDSVLLGGRLTTSLQETTRSTNCNGGQCAPKSARSPLEVEGLTISDASDASPNSQEPYRCILQ